MWIIALYILSIILQLIVGDYYVLNRSGLKGKRSPTNISLYIFIILEYSAFAFLLSRFINLILLKKYLILSCVLFTVVAVLIWFSNLPFRSAASVTTTIESISLIPFCLYYFVELLKKRPFLKLTGEPSFWITTGILFLFICITPYYLLYAYFKKYPEMHMIDFLGYDLLVLFLAKSSLVEIKQPNYSSEFE
jgi:hypothetical protein